MLMGADIGAHLISEPEGQHGAESVCARARLTVQTYGYSHVAHLVSVQRRVERKQSSHALIDATCDLAGQHVLLSI